MKKLWKIILLASLFLGVLIGSKALAEEQTGISVGDIIEFGKYEQDNIFENGSEPIEWIVLDIQNEKALVLSYYGLDAVQFHNKQTSYGKQLNWENCSLRTWLNQSFFDTAFSTYEKELITTVLVQSSDSTLQWSAENNLPEGDKVFLLSVNEAGQYLDKRNCCCKATPFAKSKRLWISWDGNCWWWLRTPGEETGYVAHIGTEGDFHIYGNRATARDGAVRPALWICLENHTSEP